MKPIPSYAPLVPVWVREAVSNPSHGITQFLAGGLASVTAAFGGLGAIDGALGRVVRNYPDESRVLLVVIAVALSFGVILPAVSKRIPDVVLAVGAVSTGPSHRAICMVAERGRCWADA